MILWLNSQDAATIVPRFVRLPHQPAEHRREVQRPLRCRLLFLRQVELEVLEGLLVDHSGLSVRVDLKQDPRQGYLLVVGQGLQLAQRL